MSPPRIKALASRHAITLTKLRGQHFLTDTRILEEIVKAAHLSAADTVLEIGPGFGALTQKLAERAGRVIAVELDRRFEPVLRETLADFKNIDLVWGDVLRTPLSISPLRGRGEKGFLISSLLRSKGEDKDGGFKIVSNLPYEITTPFLWKFLGPDARALPEASVILIQREVAERIVGGKRMSLLALLVSTFGHPEIVCRVPRASFWPPPRVDSAVLCIRRRADIAEGLRRRVLTLARRGFSSPRRKLAPLLVSCGLPREVIEAELSRCEVRPDARAEQLDLKAWLCIARAPWKKI